MEGFCRSCLVKYDEPTDLIPYTEKNRRLFVYATGLQVKRNDTFTFQLCKECYLNMKVGCTFKKTCRNSDKKLKNYLANKEVGDSVDFCTFIKNNDDSFKFRLPMHNGNSTPANRNKEDDNESTCTSIQNFMTEILRPDEILDSEARIIKEVIEEEADILEDSLDSHWLQDDVSIDTDFRLDFSFSLFSTPRSTNGDNFNSPKKLNNPTTVQKDNVPPVEFEIEKVVNEIENFIAPVETVKCDDTQKNEKCTIDINLENALKNDSAKKFMLDELLATPPVIPNISAPSTPMIANILFGDEIEIGNEMKSKNVYVPTVDIKDDVFYDFFDENNDNKTKDEKYDDMYSVDNGNYKTNDTNNVNGYKNEIIDIKEPVSPIENKYCLEKFYCKICERQFKSVVALKVHCMKRHKIKIEKPKTKRIRRHMICDHCGKLFTSSRCIVKHIQNHMKPYQYDCDHCPLSFRTEVGVKTHMTTHGIRYKSSENNNKRTLKKYVCNVCGSVQTNSSNYHTHMRRHANKYTKSCSVCGKGFYRTCDLDAHMRRHTGERPYECMYCPSTFSRQDSLNRHIKCHTGEKPFSCTFCDSKFISNKVLTNHQMKNKMCLEKQMMVGDTAMMSPDDIMVHYGKFSSNDTENIVKKIIT